ncbi:hypothetical protein CKO28_00495 [Rhodovibrio sodomensis]|uniref:YtxH domain-containing protein n=1 Tax=Rhodovibrio sodomensis TaxID=1088 RepID=A0ABS1D7X3_9PROT|nr:hypothetical protein [Rhodovibrio sodomensis]MBK1666519.1 hypothetical protein [Rhodovibrio sodomensis]
MEFLRLLRFSKAAEVMGVTSPQAREAKKATVGFVIAGVLLGFLLAPEGQIEKWNRGLDQIDQIMAAKEEKPTTSMDQDPFKVGQEMAQGLIGAMAGEEQLAQAGGGRRA